MFFNLAFNGYLPHLLPSARDRLEGNGQLQTSASVAQVAGPGLGGLIAQVVGAVFGLLIDAITFLVSAACLLSLRPGPEPRPVRADRPRMFRQIAESFAVFRQGGFLLPMLAVATMINCGMLSIWALRIVFLLRADGAAPATAGALISLSSLGGILGAALASRTVSRFGSARTYLVANVVTAPFMLLLPASGPGWRLALFAAGSFLVMANATMSGVITLTFSGNYIPAHLLGRVTAATGFVSAGTVPLGAAAAGALATALGIRTALRPTSDQRQTNHRRACPSCRPRRSRPVAGMSTLGSGGLLSTVEQQSTTGRLAGLQGSGLRQGRDGVGI